ncbi:MAG: cyclin-dependent kinase inhibitor 3 family protein [Anaeromyxobacteraceae bacterium]
MNEIRVDFLAPETHGLPGRLGLTIAPGKWREGLDAASDDLVRDDLARLRDQYGARVLVTLLEEFEMKRLGIPELLPVARRMRFQVLWFPIPDVTAPSDLDATARLVGQIVDALAAGETVVVHCRGGLGRSGTIAACCLVARGRAPAEAIAMVRAARPGAIEVRAQEDFVGRFARRPASTDTPASRPPRSRRP